MAARPAAAGRRGLRATALSVLLAATAALGGCTAAQAPDAATTPAESTAPIATPPSPRLPVDADALVARFETLAAEIQVPGAAMLVRTPDGEVTATYGVTEPGGSTPVSLDDHFRVGSNTKTWTGTVILQMVQEGRLSLTDPVSQYRPDVPNGDAITIEQLLTMRSGLFNYTETYELNKTLDDDPEHVWDAEELVAMGLALPPYFAPGEGWHYSNTNTLLLGLIAEQLDGEPLRDIYRDRLFAPLGLEETSYPAPDDASLPEPFSRGAMFTDNIVTLASARLPEDLLVQAQAGTLAPNDQTDVNPSWAGAAGAGISTIEDLADWAEALAGGGLLDDDLQQERLASVETVPVRGLPDPAYGWGIARFRALYGHTGELPGYNSFMGHDPIGGVTIVVWANLAPLPDGRPPAVLLGVDLMSEIYGTPEETTP